VQQHRGFVSHRQERASLRHQQPIDLAEEPYSLVLVAQGASPAQEGDDLFNPYARFLPRSSSKK